LGIAQLITTVTCIISDPFDTFRERMMFQIGRSKIHYKNTVDFWKKIAQTEDSGAFHKVALSNVIRCSGGASILVLFDQFKKVQGEKK
jgi:hypothetical protein